MEHHEGALGQMCRQRARYDAWRDRFGTDKSNGLDKYNHPKMSKSDCIHSEVESFVERVFDNSTYGLMASLVQEGNLTEKERHDIIKILSELEE